MADLGDTGFDATQHEPTAAGSFEPMPKGDYIAIVTDSEWRKTKDETGSYLALTFEILEGEYKGRFYWLNLNIFNPNPKAVKIAKENLAALCLAVGKPKIRDSAELHNVPLVLCLKLKKNKGTGELENQFTGAKPKSAAATSAPTSKPAGGMPWNR